MLRQECPSQIRELTYRDFGIFFTTHEKTITQEYKKLIEESMADDVDNFTRIYLKEKTLHAVASKWLDEFKIVNPKVSYDSIVLNGGEQTNEEMILFLLKIHIEMK